MSEPVVKPRIVRISRTPETEGLYRLERARNDAIQSAARKLAAISHHPPGEYWTRTIPQALFDLLESFQVTSAYVAAKAYVEYVEQRWPDMKDTPVVEE